MAIRLGDEFETEIFVNTTVEVERQDLVVAVHCNIDNGAWHDVLAEGDNLRPGVDVGGHAIPGAWFAKINIHPQSCGHYEFKARAMIKNGKEDWQWTRGGNVYLQVHNLPEWAALGKVHPYYLFIPDVEAVGLKVNWTGVKEYILRTHKQTGKNLFILSPFFPTPAESPFTPLSVYALSPRFVDWQAVEEKGNSPLDKFRNFKNMPKQARSGQFESFCRFFPLFKYAMFVAIQVFSGKENCVHGVKYKADDFSSFAEVVEFMLYEQFIGFEQLLGLLRETSVEKINILGDLPFYRAQAGVEVADQRECFIPGNKFVEEWLAIQALKASVSSDLAEIAQNLTPYAELKERLERLLPALNTRETEISRFLPQDMQEKLSASTQIMPGTPLAEILGVESPGFTAGSKQCWGDLAAWNDGYIEQLVKQGGRDPRELPFEFWENIFLQVFSDRQNRISGWRLDALHMYGIGSYNADAKRTNYSTYLWDKLAEFFNRHELLPIIEQLGADSFAYEHFKKLGFIQYALILDLKSKNLTDFLNDLTGISRGIAFTVVDTHDTQRWSEEYLSMLQYLAQVYGKREQPLSTEQILQLTGPAFLGVLSLGPRMETAILSLGEFATEGSIKREIKDSNNVTVGTEWGTKERGKNDFCSWIAKFVKIRQENPAVSLSDIELIRIADHSDKKEVPVVDFGRNPEDVM